MARNISKEIVELRIKASFNPLECFVQLEDRKNRIGFRVFDESDQSIYNSKSILIQQAQNTIRLNKILLLAIKYIEAQGFILEPLVLDINP